MEHVTTLLIALEIPDDEVIEDVVGNLPEYCVSSFTEAGTGLWKGQFEVSCPQAPKLAEGDFVNDLCPHFPTLLELKSMYSAKFEFRIAVGKPAEEFWNLAEHSVALLAALGASIRVHAAPSRHQTG
jgi:hypothetical protein